MVSDKTIHKATGFDKTLFRKQNLSEVFFPHYLIYQNYTLL